jgi:hypothetical protein
MTTQLNTQTEMKAATTMAATEALTSLATGKKFYMSKTFWANMLAAAVLGVQMKYGFIIDAEIQAWILSGINLALRKITSQPVTW